MNPWTGILLISLILSGAVFGLSFFRRRCSPHPELLRKILHITMGIVTLGFPWLFEDFWPVLVLGIISTGFLLACRYLGPVNRHLGGVIDGVNRHSYGGLVFPLSVTVLFYLARHRPVLYCIPILILTLADGISALVGIRYGFTSYSTAEGKKSVEGSLAFFITAFLSAHVPLLLYTDTGRAESLLIAVNLGLLVMMLEGIAWLGLDNVFIPVGGYVLLHSFMPLGVAPLTLRLGVTVAVLILSLALRRRTTLNDAALLGAALTLSVTWSVGGWPYLYAPLTLMITHFLIFPIPEKDRGIHTVAGVAAVTFPGLFWLFMSSITGRSEYLFPYVVSYAAHLAIIGMAWTYHHRPDSSSPALVLLPSIKGWALIVLPFVLLYGKNPLDLWGLLPGFLAITTAVLVYFSTHPRRTGFSMSLYHWARQGVSSTLASLLILAFL